MCAALSALEHDATVLLVERGEARNRGGNSKYTRNLRCASDLYPEDELLADLISVTGEEIDVDLAALAIRQSREAPAWMESHGVRWQGATTGLPVHHPSVSRRNGAEDAAMQCILNRRPRRS